MRDLNSYYKKSTVVVVISLVILLAAGTVGVIHVVGNKKVTLHQVVKSAVPVTQTQNPDIISYTAVAGKSVLEQLQSHEKNVVTVSSSQGIYVDSINGIKGGTNNKYWGYYVNGKLATIGAAEYKTVGGEAIVWKFE